MVSRAALLHRLLGVVGHELGDPGEDLLLPRETGEIAPVDESRPTYREIVALAAQELDADAKCTVVPSWALRAAGLVSPAAREIRELLPRYAHDNIFDATRFRTRFPDFDLTTFREGLARIRAEASAR